jgi:hypothetical protein
MKRTNVILLSLAVTVPIAIAVRIKAVSGSEPPGRLVVNGDGSVTDTVTTLIWQQATGPVQAEANAGPACTSLSIGSHTSGWRLPTVKELLSIVDLESPTSPTIDTVAFPGSQAAYYWTGTASPTGGSLVLIYFDTGQIYTGSSAGAYYTRCVHSSP